MVKVEIRKANRDLLNARKDKCCICGEDEFCCLEMHHTKNKQYDISKAVKYLLHERFKKELDRCVCLCSNCHRKVHHNICRVEQRI